MKKLLLALLITFFITGCGNAQHEETGNVQDIKPGDKSVIQPPDNTRAAPASKLEEKPL